MPQAPQPRAARQQRAAQQTLNLYAPLANRLGVWQFKWELEDLSFRFLEPATYQNVAQMLDERRGDREEYIEHVAELLRQAIHAEGLHVAVQGRPKHIYSIYKKMQEKKQYLFQNQKLMLSIVGKTTPLFLRS